jgi:hypothetical protein
MLNASGPVGPTVKLGLDVSTGGVGEVYWGRQLTELLRNRFLGGIHS